MSATASPRYVLDMAHHRYLGGYINSNFNTWKLAATAKVPCAGGHITSVMYVWVRAPLVVGPPRCITDAVQRLADGTCGEMVDLLQASGVKGYNATEDSISGWCVKDCSKKGCSTTHECFDDLNEEGDRGAGARSGDDKTLSSSGGHKGKPKSKDGGKPSQKRTIGIRKGKSRAATDQVSGETVVEQVRLAKEAAAAGRAKRVEGRAELPAPTVPPPGGGSQTKARGRSFEQNKHYDVVKDITKFLVDARGLTCPSRPQGGWGAPAQPPQSAPEVVNIVEHRIAELTPHMIDRMNETDVGQVRRKWCEWGGWDGWSEWSELNAWVNEVCEVCGVSGVEWSGVEWSGVEWSGVEWSCVCVCVCVWWSGVEFGGVLLLKSCLEHR